MRNALRRLKFKTVSLVLRRARRMVSRGRHRAAIDFLHWSNKRLNAPRIDVALRDLRHEAFFELQHPAPPGPWPPVTVDEFPGLPLIPEIDRRDVTPDIVRSGVFQRGSIVIRGLLPAADVAVLAEGISHAYAAHDRHLNGEPLDRTSPWYLPFDPPPRDGRDGSFDRLWYRITGAELAADSPRTLERLITAFERNGVIDLVESYLGERPALSVLKTSLREIPFDIDARNGWHQDGAFLGKNIRTLNVWIALTDCGVDAPSMDMVPRRLSSIVPSGTEGAQFDWSVSPTEIERACGPDGYTHLEFSAGDAILFDEMNLHRTSSLPGMTKNRKAIEAWFFAPSHYPVDQFPLLV